jgi:hypothetical protein
MDKENAIAPLNPEKNIMNWFLRLIFDFLNIFKKSDNGKMLKNLPITHNKNIQNINLKSKYKSLNPNNDIPKYININESKRKDAEFNIVVMVLSDSCDRFFLV